MLRGQIRQQKWTHLQIVLYIKSLNIIFVIERGRLNNKLHIPHNPYTASRGRAGFYPTWHRKKTVQMIISFLQARENHFVNEGSVLYLATYDEPNGDSVISRYSGGRCLIGIMAAFVAMAGTGNNTTSISERFSWPGRTIIDGHPLLPGFQNGWVEGVFPKNIRNEKDSEREVGKLTLPW